jgi:hypothetical protein
MSFLPVEGFEWEKESECEMAFAMPGSSLFLKKRFWLKPDLSENAPIGLL